MSNCIPCEPYKLPDESSKTASELCPCLTQDNVEKVECVPIITDINNIAYDYLNTQMTKKVCEGYHKVDKRVDIYIRKEEETPIDLCECN